MAKAPAQASDRLREHFTVPCISAAMARWTLSYRDAVGLIFLLLALVVSVPLRAQPDPLASASQRMAQAEADVRAVDRALDGRVDAAARRALRAKAVGARQVATTASAALNEELALIDARIAGLGPADPGEAADIRTQRKQLGGERSALDSAIRRSGLADVEAGQLIDEIDRGEAAQFAQEVSTQVASPLTPSFWSSVLTAMPRDFRRIGHFVSQGREQIDARWHGGLPWGALLGAVLAFALLVPARTAARRFGQRYLIADAPGHRVRRSGFAIWRTLVDTLSPLLAAVALVAGMRWSGLLPERWSELLTTFVAAAGFAGFTAAVTGALLMRSQPSWRVAPIDDETAIRLRPLSWFLAALAFCNLLLHSFNKSVSASQAATVVTETFSALLHILLIGMFLMALSRIRIDRARQGDDAGFSTRAGLGLVELLVWLALVVATVALAIGYVGLAGAIVGFITWGVVLGSSGYLLARGIDDVITTLFTRQSRFGQMLTGSLGLRGSAIDQFGLILSGFLRIGLLIILLGLLLTPFGAGGGVSSMFGRLGLLAQGIEIGGIAISPGAILRGVIVLVVGLALVRAFMSWLEKRYLPVTDLDGSGRNSVSLVARYVGIALAVIWALASLGIGVERIALLLSALSVGIGFGLQAITQNFVSGLILLAERPIKIGDLIKVGNDEGDVKRISVRSTEIELGDHSTLIVPNSDLITKPVLNKTMSSPLGRVQIQFSVPIETDSDLVLQLLTDAYAGEAAILKEPGPSVFIDSIVDGRIVFNSFAHVAGPRDAYRARSNVFITLLRSLREENVDIGTPPQILMGPPAPAA